MKKLENYYNKDYSIKSIYVVKTALMIFVLGMLVYYLSGKLGGAVSFVSSVFEPFVLGLVMTYLLSPIVKKFEKKVFGKLKRRRNRRTAAVILTFVIVFTAVGLILGLIAVTVSKSISSINVADFKEYIIILSNQFSKFWATIEKQLTSMNINLGKAGDMLGRIFNGVKSGASTLLFATIFSIYFLLDYRIRKYWKSVLDVFTNEKTRAMIHQFAADSDRVFSGYIRGQSIDALLIGGISSVALFIAGIPYAIVIGILTGIGNLVPYVGPVVGFGSLIIVCLAEGSWMHLLIGGAILAAVMFVDGNIINPRMLSSNVEVHPVLVIVALLAGGKIGGVVGMLVAVPVAALIKQQFDKLVERKKQQKEMQQQELKQKEMQQEEMQVGENIPESSNKQKKTKEHHEKKQ